MKDGTVALNLLFIACLLSDVFIPFLAHKSDKDSEGLFPNSSKARFFQTLIVFVFIALPSILFFTFTGNAALAVSVFCILTLHFVFCSGASAFASSSSVFSRRLVRAVSLVAFDAAAFAAGLVPVSVYDMLDSVLTGFTRISSLTAYGILAFIFPAMILVRGSGSVKRRIETCSLMLSAVLLYVLALQYDQPVDLTRERSYSISPLTESALSGLESELLVTWYRSDLLVMRDRERTRISGILDLYRRASGGRLAVEEVSVGPEEAEYPGMTMGAVILPGGKGIAEAVSGFLLEYRGRTAVIPYLRDAASFEYNMTKRILSLVGEEEPLCVELYQGSTRATGVYAYLEDHLAAAEIEVNTLQSDADIHDWIMIVIGSQYLDESAVASIRSRLEDGANAVFLVSGTFVGISKDWSAVPKDDDTLMGLLEELGVYVGRTIILDPAGCPLALPSLDGSSIVTIPYRYWSNIGSDEFPRDHSLFSGLNSLQFFWPSAITLDPSVGARCLLKSNPASIEALPPFNTNPFDMASIQDDGSRSESRCLAASIERNGGQRLLFVSDELLPSSMIEYTGSRGNLDFIVNCIEWLSGRDDLLSLKKRGRP